MEIASIIISILSLLMSITVMVMYLAKHFSQHTIQYVPIDPFNGEKPKVAEEVMDLRPFDEPLSEEEEEYFKKQK